MSKTKKTAKKRINTARKGACFERLAVNNHIKNGALLSARFASSKCKGILHSDVIAIYPNGTIYLEQYKNSTSNYEKEIKNYMETPFPSKLSLVRKFVTPEYYYTSEDLTNSGKACTIIKGS